MEKNKAADKGKSVSRNGGRPEGKKLSSPAEGADSKDASDVRARANLIEVSLKLWSTQDPDFSRVLAKIAHFSKHKPKAYAKYKSILMKV